MGVGPQKWIEILKSVGNKEEVGLLWQLRGNRRRGKMCCTFLRHVQSKLFIRFTFIYKLALGLGFRSYLDFIRFILLDFILE